MTNLLIQEIPANQYNAFAVDDFVRTLHDPIQRRRLIQEAGSSSIQRMHYEMQNDLIYGSIELAMLADDERLIQIGKTFSLEWTDAMAANDYERIRELQNSMASSLTGLKKQYPAAFAFLDQYARVNSRIQGAYRPQFIQVGSTCINTDTIANVYVLVNGAVYANAVLATLVFVALGAVLVIGAFAVVGGGSPGLMMRKSCSSN
jgi:hypothetical protein